MILSKRPFCFILFFFVFLNSKRLLFPLPNRLVRQKKTQSSHLIITFAATGYIYFYLIFKIEKKKGGNFLFFIDFLLIIFKNELIIFATTTTAKTAKKKFFFNLK